MTEVAGLVQRGAFREALAASEQLVARLPDVDEPYRGMVAPLELATAWHDHGRLCWQLARFPEATAALDRAYRIRRKAHGEDHADTLDTLERLAAVAAYEANAELAHARFERAIEGLVRLHGDDHPRVAIARRNHSAFLRDNARPAAARVEMERACDVLERSLPPDDPEQIAALKADAYLHFTERSFTPALKLAERAIERATRCWGADHPYTAAAELTAANAEAELGSHSRARKRLEHVQRSFERSYGDHPLLAIAWHHRARLELTLHTDLVSAARYARRALELYRRTYPDRVHMGAVLVEILIAQGELAPAIAVVGELAPLAQARQRGVMTGKLANALTRAGRYAEAIPWITQTRDAAEAGDLRQRWDAELTKWARYLRQQ